MSTPGSSPFALRDRIRNIWPLTTKEVLWGLAFLLLVPLVGFLFGYREGRIGKGLLIGLVVGFFASGAFAWVIDQIQYRLVPFFLPGLRTAFSREVGLRLVIMAGLVFRWVGFISLVVGLGFLALRSSDKTFWAGSASLALAVALCLTDIRLWVWEGQLREKREEIGSAVDEKIEQIARVSRRVDILERQMDALLKRMAKTEAENHKSEWARPDRKLAAFTTKASLPEIATQTDLERAIMAAVQEVRPTSRSHMGMVIKAARACLKGKTFDEKQLCDLVSAHLPEESPLQRAVACGIRKSGRNATSFSLVSFKIESFSAIADAFGDTAGDTLLTEIEEKTRSLCKEDDCVVPEGGGRFALLVHAPKAEARAIITNLRELLQVSDRLVNGRRVRLAVEFGVATYPDDAKTPDELIERSEQASHMSAALFLDGGSRTGRNEGMPPGLT